jgi:chemotaxis protein CheX
MNLEHFVADSIRQSTRKVFDTMIGAHLLGGHHAAPPEPKAATDGVVSFIGISGKWKGVGSLVCSPSMACRICAGMLQTGAVVVDDDVLDAMAELTNMIIGGVKTDLEAELGPLLLSIPTVVYGKHITTRSGCQSEWTALRFAWDGDPLPVRLCLSENKSGAYDQRRYGGTQRFAVGMGE